MRGFMRLAIVHREVANAIQLMMHTLAQQNAKRISFPDIIGGTGWTIELTGGWMILKARGKR